MKELLSYFSNLQKINKIVFSVGLIGIIISIIGIQLSDDESLILFYDNMHWTFGTVSAALLAYLGFLTKKSDTTQKSSFWFFIGFSAYAIGQIIWDIQTYISYSEFPSPSDFFYLLLGPAISIGLFFEVIKSNNKINKYVFLLDLLALSVATLTLILVSYIPRKGDLDFLSIGVLVSYPTTLLIPVLMILLMITSMRLNFKSHVGIFFIALSITAFSWMHWNSMALDGLTSSGSWFNTTFSIAILIAGLTVSNWQLSFVDNEKYDRFSEGFLRFLPITTVILSSTAIIIVDSYIDSTLVVRQLVYVGAAIVIIIASIRQGRLLKERDELLEAQSEALKSANIIKTILNTAPLRIFWKDNDLNYLGCNDLFAKDAGFKHAEQIIGKSDYEMGWKAEANLYRSDDINTIKSGISTIGYEEPQTTPDGNQIWLRTSKVPLKDPNTAETIGVLGVYEDITLQHTISQRLKFALSGSSDGLWDWNMQTNEVYYSPRWFEMLGYKFGDFEETLDTWSTLIHPDDRVQTLSKVNDYITGKVDKFDIEFRMKHKDGHWVDILSRAKLAEDDNGNLLTPRRLVGTHVDITNRKKLEQQLHHIANYDTLTNLPNRYQLSYLMEKALNESRDNQTSVAILYLDLDGFKEVNDEYGHEIGDKLLVTISNRIQITLQKNDIVARLGGDEFVIILKDVEQNSDVEIAIEKILSTTSQPITISNYIIQISASIGVTYYSNQENIDSDQLIRQADQAMYFAKQSGKNRYHIFDHELDESIRTQHEKIERIKHALENNEFILYYQPKVNMRSGKVIGAEALIRWQHPQLGLLPPSSFLPDIANNILIAQLGDWVLESAMKQIEQWHNQGIDIPVSINIDNTQLQQSNFINNIKSLLQKYKGVRKGDLEFEILETSALEDITYVGKVINECRDLGITFSIDDFGTGYSSLTYLKRLPVSRLKIDQSFVFDLLIDPEELAIIEGIQELASTFKREIIAEGVESILHGSLLLLMGCDDAQGYAIAKPMEAEAISNWIGTWRSPIEWQEQISYSEKNLPLAYAIVENQAWVIQIIEYVTNNHAQRPLIKPTECKFGEWLKEAGKDSVADISAFNEINTLHENLHNLAKEIIDDFENKNVAKISEKIIALKNIRDEMLQQLLQSVIF